MLLGDELCGKHLVQIVAPDSHGMNLNIFGTAKTFATTPPFAVHGYSP